MAGRVISAVLKFKDQNFSTGLKKANKDAGDFGRYMQKAQNKITKFGQKADEIFKGVGVAAGALASGAIAGLGAAVGQTILEMDSAFAKLQAQTGATGVDLTNLENAAKEAFTRGYGESLSEVSDAVARVSQNMHNIDPSQLADVTAQAMLLAQTTDSDINEVTRGAQNLMNTFGISAQEAFDLFAKGAQDGLNLSNDMFDQMSEFSAVAARSGYTAEELFGTMAKGAENSVYNLDRINNSILNFGDLTTDGNKATSDSFKLLSDSTQQMWADMKAGKVTAKELSSTVIQELKAMDDQAKANETGISMWGSAWIDNTPEVMYAMFETTEAMKDFEGATDAAAQAVESSFGNRVKSAFRDLTTRIASLADSEQGKELLDSIAKTAEDLVPKIESLAKKAIEFANVIKDNWEPIKETVIALTATLVTLRLGFFAMSIVNTVTKWYGDMKKMVTLAGGAFKALNLIMKANPMGLVITAVSLLVGGIIALYRNSETFRGIWDSVWNGVKKAAEVSINAVIEEINRLIELVNKIPGVNVPLIATVKFVEENKPGPLTKSPKIADNVAAEQKAQNILSKYSRGSYGAEAIKNLSSYDVGSNRITHDQIAQVHKDEMIIPARQAQKVRQAGGTIDNIDKLINKPSQAVPIASSTTNHQTTAPIIHMTVNANQLSYDDVVYRLSKDIKLALSNM